MRAFSSILFLVLSLLLCVSVSAQEQETSADDAEAPQVETVSRNQKLMGKIAGLLDKVETSYPEFSRFLAQSDDKLIGGFIRALDDRIVLMDKKNAEASKLSAVPETLSFQALEIPSKNLLYCRIDSFNPDSLKQLAADLEKINSKDSKTSAVIIDLRNCGGVQADCAMSALKLLCDNKKLPLTDENKRILKKPFAVLTANTTSGSAEVFSYMVKENSLALLIGAKTAGKPFEYKIVDLYGDKVLAIPIIPEFLKKMNVKSVASDIECKSTQISYEKSKDAPDSISDDKAVSLASDILKSINIVNQN